MATVRVGVLHPGQMGATIAATCQGDCSWVGAGRSASTRGRAEAAGLSDAGTLENMVGDAEVIVSVCPPGEALAQAEAVAALGFAGIYVDANAVAPETARSISTHFERFVDGGIIGPPATAAGTTRLYLSGSDAAHVAELWGGSVLETRIVDGGPGAASAVKMCFAAWTKGTSALLLAVRALAEAEGVSDDLLGEWATSMPDLITRTERTAAGVGPKAWRFVGEMEQIAATFAAADLPDEFHRGAAEVYRRLAGFKDTASPGLDEVMAELRRSR